MAAGTVTIVKRPQGKILSTTPVSAIVYNNGYGVAIVSSIAHGLNTGDYIYIYSLLGSYNGYWYVNVLDSNNFEIQEYQTASPQVFINSGSIIYYPYVYKHGVSCVHLPIVYKLTNTLWPNNTGGTTQTVSSFANDSNYVKLTLSGSLGTFNALNYIKITGANSSAVIGSWQILTKWSSSIVTINLPYNSGYDFTNGTVILYYNNYKVQVNVWAGLNASHPWALINPYTKILSLPVVPDNTNIVKLNINEFLKPALNIMSNNLQLDTLPSNTDFFCQFYIEYQESYDQSDGVNVTTYISDLVSDQINLEGVAINAKLPFKSRSSGYLNDYIMNAFGKFLTVFSAPVLFACQNNVGCYQDVSFINNFSKNLTGLTLQQTYYIKGVDQSTVNLNVPVKGIGLYRVPVSYSSTNFDQVNIALIGTFTGNSTRDIGTLIQEGGGAGTWSNAGGSFPVQYTRASVGGNAIVYFDFEAPAGSYFLQGTYDNITSKNGTLQGFFLDANLNIIGSASLQNITSGTTFGAVGGAISSSKTIRYVAFQAAYTSGSGTWTLGLNYAIYDAPEINTPVPVQISQTQTYKISSVCSDQSIMLGWLNQLGGFDYWQFNGRSTHGIDIQQVITLQKNVYTDWPQSWGEFANTIKAESKRLSFTRTLCRSQNVDISQIDAIATIKKSPLVQIVNSQYDTRTVLIDSNSFDIRKDGDKTFNISFTMVYTDPISAQEL